VCILRCEIHDRPDRRTQESNLARFGCNLLATQLPTVCLRSIQLR